MIDDAARLGRRLSAISSRGRIALHAFLEAAHGAAQVFADISQLFGPENQDDDGQNNQPVPDA